MKCPNCGKEAISVNGKYVCLDCGVELIQTDSNNENSSLNSNTAPKDQVQGQTQEPEQVIASDSLTDSLNSQNQEVSQPAGEVGNSLDEATQETPINFMETGIEHSQEEIKKPVEEAIVNELKVSSEPSETGSYDFTNTSSNTTADIEKPSSEIPAPEVTSDQNNVLEPVEEDYFKPNTFDIKNEPLNNSIDSNNIVDDISASAPVNQGMDSVPIAPSNNTQEIPQGSNTQVVSDFPEVPSSNNNDNSQVDSNTNNTPQDVFDPIAPAGGMDLDSLLNQYNNPTQTDYNPEGTSQNITNNYNVNQNMAQPINNFDSMQSQEPPQVGVPVEEAVNTSKIPSVESVFGNNPRDDITQPQGATDTPLSVGKKNSGKLWIIIIAIIGGLLLLSGIGFGVYYFFFKDSNVATEQVLSEVDANNLSQNITSAMSSLENLLVNFDEKLDFSQVTYATNEGEGDTAKKENNYSNNGFFEIDKDGDVYIFNSINGIANKRTFINEEAKTYIYNQKEEKYDEIDGFQLVNNPILYGISADKRSEFLYSTNVDSLVEYEKVQKDGSEYRKIKINFNDEYIKEILSAYDEEIKSSDFNFREFNKDNLEAFVYISPDNRISELSIKGTISVKSEKMNGVINIFSRGIYNYQEVVINNPKDILKEKVEVNTEDSGVITENNNKGAPVTVSEEKNIPKPETEVIDARG